MFKLFKFSLQIHYKCVYLVLVVSNNTVFYMITILDQKISEKESLWVTRREGGKMKIEVVCSSCSSQSGLLLVSDVVLGSVNVDTDSTAEGALHTRSTDPGSLHQ